MQVKFIVPQNKNWYELESEINLFLNELDDSPNSIKYDIENCTAIIEYEEVRKGALCCECRFWDGGDSTDKLIGFCQRCGGRKRFSDKACNKYEDIRKR